MLIKSDVFGKPKLLTSNIIWVILGEFPNPPPAPDHCKGGPIEGLNEGGDFMSVTPKCDKFL